MDGSLTSEREGSAHGAALLLYRHKVALNMQKDGTVPISEFPELQHIFLGIAFHRRAQAVKAVGENFLAEGRDTCHCQPG